MMDLTTKAVVKEYLGITVATYDALIDSLITRMSAFVVRYTKRTFSDTEFTEYYDGTEFNDGTLIALQYPIISITSLHDDINRVFGSDTLIDPAKYVFMAVEGIIQLLQSNPTYYASGAITGTDQFQVGRQNLRLIYHAGFATVPEDIVQAMCELVGGKMNIRKSHGVKSERLGRWSTTYGTVVVSNDLGVIPVSASVTEILEGYKARRLYVL